MGRVVCVQRLGGVSVRCGGARATDWRAPQCVFRRMCHVHWVGNVSVGQLSSTVCVGRSVRQARQGSRPRTKNGLGGWGGGTRCLCHAASSARVLSHALPVAGGQAQHGGHGTRVDDPGVRALGAAAPGVCRLKGGARQGAQHAAAPARCHVGVAGGAGAQ
eukprot:218991-Chlamydomonas_euryale.AAC.1